MTINEGKVFLINCLRECNKQNDIDELICYKTGNKKTAKAYNSDEIPTQIKSAKEIANVKFVVKCFTYLEIYAAWPVAVGRGSGKYITYKKDLIAMENNSECCYQEVLVNENDFMYLFRGEDGVKKFIEEHLLSD